MPSTSPPRRRAPDAPPHASAAGGATALARVSTALALAAIAALALLLRTLPVASVVRSGGPVRFLSTDPWYHLRLIDNLVRNFPHRLRFDPYLFFPGGQPVETGPLLDLVVASVALAAGRGSPSVRTVELTAAWLPPVVGVLAVLVVYAIGRRALGSGWGLFAAALLAVEPGLFLDRSLLGYTDHHVLEVALSSLTVLLLLRALPPAGGRAAAGRPGEARAGSPRPTRRALAAGLALGAYLLAWAGGSFFVVALLAWATAQYLLEAARGAPPPGVARVTVPLALGALAVVLPAAGTLSRPFLHLGSLAALLLTPVALELGARAIRAWRLPRLLLPLAVAASAIAAVLAVRVAAPGSFTRAAAFVARLAPGGAALTVGEVRPLLTMSGVLSLRPAWAIFGAPLFLGAAGLVLLARRALRDARPADTLVAVWSAVIVVMTLVQVRFGYYLAVNAALLTAYLCRSAWGEGGAVAPAPAPRVAPAPPFRWRAPVAAAVAVLAFAPSLRLSLLAVEQARGPSPAWREALAWLGANTSEPLGDPGAYYERVASPRPGEAYAYPPSAYGVLSWWDYGYWILRIAHRIPNANPTQRGAETAARFLVAADPARADAILDHAGTRYVVGDGGLGTWTPAQVLGGSGQFAAALDWAGEDPSRVRAVLWTRDSDGRLHPLVLYLPEYYRAMAVRLFGGADGPAPTPGPTWAVATRERRDGRGREYREVADMRRFESYEAAAAFLATQADPRWLLGGLDPARSCVRLEPLARLRLVHEAPATTPDGAPGSPVRVYEYTGWRPGDPLQR